MRALPTSIPAVVIIEPAVFGDLRGSFTEIFRSEWFRKHIADIEFVQENESVSRRGVLRGLHFQHPPHAQAKLVRVACGAVLDVAVDLREGSPTLGQWISVELSATNRRQLYIPAGFAHGFLALENDTVLQYRCSDYYAPQAEAGLNAFDAALGIDWGIDPAEAILSDKDRRNKPYHLLSLNFHP